MGGQDRHQREPGRLNRLAPLAYAVVAVALGAVLQMLALGVPPSAPSAPDAGLSPLQSPVMVEGYDLSPLPATPTYFPAALFPTAIPSPTPTLAPAASTVEAATARVNAEGGQLTREEVTAVLRAAGAAEEWIAPMLTIAWCESKFSPLAKGDSGNSLGLFQLWRGWFRAGEDPFDALTNARVAVRVRDIRGRFGGGGGWSCATNNGIP